MEARSRVGAYFLIEILFYSHLNVSDWVAWFCTLYLVASGYGPLCAKRKSVAALLVYACACVCCAVIERPESQ